MKQTVLLLWLLVVGTSVFQPPVQAAETSRKVLAHYLCWFEDRPYRGSTRWEHWSYKLHGTPHDAQSILQTGKRDIASVYYPLIGPYDSDDPDVIEYHVLSAKVAGIDGFVIDWYQPGSIIDTALEQLAGISAKYKFQFLACYEEKAAFPGYRNPKTRDDAVKLAVDDFSYLLGKYGTNEGYFKLNGKPVVFMFLGQGAFCGQEAVFNYMELANIKDAVKNPDWLLFREHINASYWSSARGSFEWVGDNAYHTWFQNTARELKESKKLDYVAFGVSPGFDSSGVSSWGQGHAVIPREEGEYYSKQWERAISSKADLVQIVTWNDFQEGSVIEPTFEFGTRYLDLTETKVGQFNGRKVDLSDNDLPFKIYQLRKRTEQRFQPDSAEFKEQKGKIDQAVSNLVDGDAKAARALIDGTAKQLEWVWLDRITAEKEFARFVPTTGKEKELADAYKLIQSSFNLARAKTVTASSSDTDAPNPLKTIDGDWTTRWASEYNQPEWLQIDLGNKESFSKVIIDWETAYGKAFAIEVSDDGNQWREVYSTKDSKGGLQTITFPKNEARYVRLNFQERATSWGFSVWEIGVF